MIIFFCVFLQGGTNLFYSNFTTKAGKRCLGIGRNPTQAAVVEVDEGLSKGSVYGLVQELVRVEVWGCGRDPERLARRQAEVKEFEAKDASKARNRKFKAEAWEDSPDRHIMEWGGVNAKHSELAGPPEDEEEEEKKWHRSALTGLWSQNCGPLWFMTVACFTTGEGIQKIISMVETWTTLSLPLMASLFLIAVIDEWWFDQLIKIFTARRLISRISFPDIC